MKEMTREAVIDVLVNDDIDTVTGHLETAYMDSIFRDGFKGYNNYTNKELKEEYEERLDPDSEGVKIKQLKEV